MNLHEWTANHPEEFEDLTVQELITIYNSVKEEEGELHDIKLKIEFILHKIAMAELLEDRCKSGRRAGEELRKKLLNGNVVFDNPVEAKDSEDGLIDAFKKVAEAKK